MNVRSKKARKKQYVDLLKVTRKALSYAQTALCLLKGHLPRHPAHLAMAQSMAEELKHYIELTRRVLHRLPKLLS